MYCRDRDQDRNRDRDFPSSCLILVAADLPPSKKSTLLPCYSAHHGSEGLPCTIHQYQQAVQFSLQGTYTYPEICSHTLDRSNTQNYTCSVPGFGLATPCSPAVSAPPPDSSFSFQGCVEPLNDAALQFKLSKKVAELTLVVHMLFTRNHEREVTSAG